jgi:hypothetical protein
MADLPECHIDGCPNGGIWLVDEQRPDWLRICNHHRDQHLMDVHVRERQRRADDSLTRPIGDPDEAMHRGGGGEAA